MTADSSLFVVILGLATTFIGLICIILLSKIMSFCCKIANRTENIQSSSNEVKSEVQSHQSGTFVQIPNRGEFVAAISAAIAEEIGTDISKIRIHSIKQI